MGKIPENLETVIFLSALPVWSIGEGKGAPSFYNTLKLYIERGHRVILVNPAYKIENKNDLIKLEFFNFPISFFDKLCSIGKVSFAGRILKAWWLTYNFIKIASRILKKSENHCLLYAYEIHGVKAAAKLAQKYHVPFITRFMGSNIHEVEDNWFNRIRRYPNFSALSQKSNMVIMTDDGTRVDRELKRFNNTTKYINIWKNGVDKRIAQYGKYELDLVRTEIRSIYKIKDDEIVLMTLCRLTGWKRIDRAIEALKEIDKVYNGCRLLIVGDGDKKQDWELLVKKYNLESKITFVGAVNQDESYKYFAACDIFLSVYDLSNVGNPLLEGLQAGKAIVTLDIGDTSTVVQNEVNGLILPADNESEIPKKIAESVLRLIRDPDLLKKIEGGAKDYAQVMLWSWKERMDEEYHRVREMLDEFYFNEQSA